MRFLNRKLLVGANNITVWVYTLFPFPSDDSHVIRFSQIKESIAKKYNLSITSVEEDEDAMYISYEKKENSIPY